jgi:hypothetical protein
MEVEIANKQIKEIFTAVWNSQEAEARMALVEKIHFVTDKKLPGYLKNDQEANTFAYVLHLPEKEAIYLLPLLHTKSEAFIKYVIAHELGHIYYNHKDSGLSYEQRECEADIYAVKTTKLVSANLIENDNEWAEIVANKNYMTADELRRYIKRDSFREELFIDQQAQNIRIISFLPLKELLDDRQNLLVVNILYHTRIEKPLFGMLSAQGKQTLKDIEVMKNRIEENTKAIVSLFYSRKEYEIKELLARYDNAYLNVKFKVTSNDLSGETEREFHQMTFDNVIADLVAFARINMKDKNNG